MIKLVPYIQRCKKSKLMTCCWSIIFLGLAIFCFFATNYMFPSYPITESRKIAFVFAGLFCLLVMASCLNLRFRILAQCRGNLDDSVVFEIARRDDVEHSDSFSAYYQAGETSQRPETHRKTSNQSETPGDASSQAVTIGDPCSSGISTSRYRDSSRLPRHSISNTVSEDVPLLPQRRPVKFFWPSWMKKGMDSIRLQIVRDASAKTKCSLNYSTFENDFDASDTDSVPESGSEAGGTKSPPADSQIGKDSDAHETESLVSQSTFENDSDAPGTESLLSQSTFRNGSDTRGTESLLSESTFENGTDSHRTESLPAESTFENGSDTHGTESLLFRPSFENGSSTSETESLPAKSAVRNGSDARETDPPAIEKP